MAYPYGATNAVSLGPFSASTLQQPSSIAIGASAGRKNQGSNAIAIGTLAGQLNQHQSTIVLNATGIPLDTTADNAVYMAPMRFVTASNVMSYNPTSKEVSHTDTLSTLTVSSLSTRSIGYSTLVGSSMNTSVITANLLYCNTISTVGGIVVGGGSGGGGGGGSSGPVSILSATPSAPQSISADTNTLVLWDAPDNAQSVGITGLTYISGLFNNVTPTALPIHVDYSLELSITGGGASYIGINGSATPYGRLLNESNIFSNAYTVLVPPGGTIGIYYRDINSTVVQTGSRITLTLLSATVGQVATMLVSPTTVQSMPASASLSLVQWGTTDNGQSYGSTGLSYSSGVFINITSMTLPVFVQYTLNLDSTMGGYSAIGINGTTTVYGGMYNDTNGFSNSYTVMLPAYGTLGIYYMDNGATNIQSSSTLRLTILMAGERGATGASPFTLSGTTASYTAGNVGIGTTAPASALDVTGTINSVGVLTVSDARPAVNGLLRLVATGGLNYIQSGLALTSDSKAPLIFGSIYGASEWMRITTAGNVGIGTTNPGYRLDVQHSLTDTTTSILSLTNPYIFAFGTGQNIGSGISFRNRWAGDGVTGVVEMCKIDARKEHNYNYGDSYLSFFTRYETDRVNGGAGTLTEKMRITATGNVGIGTASPTAPLTISRYYQNGGTHSEATDSKILLTTSSGFGVGIQLRVPDNATVNQSDLQFTTCDNGENQLVRMTILGSSNAGGGNVGIGTAGPDAPLHVYSANGIHLSNTNTVNYTQTSLIGFNFGGGVGSGTRDSFRIVSQAVNRDNGAGPYYDYGAQADLIFQRKTANTFGGAALDITYTEVMRLGGATGNVGIGTASPLDTLDVNGTLRVLNRSAGPGQNTTGNTLYPGIINLGGSYGPQIRSSYPNMAYTDNISLQFVTNGTLNTNDPQVRMHISAITGNIGIGNLGWDLYRVNITSNGGATNYPLNLYHGTNQVLAVAPAGTPSNGGFGVTNSILYVGRDTATNRSINALGTVNASGTDYAEYMYKSDPNITFQKGDIVGVTANRTLTHLFDQAVTFLIKSTDPSYVGGDIWATDAILGKKPDPPSTTAESTSLELVTLQQQYEADLAAWTVRFEAERKKVDRMAFAGQVPCNVLGAQAGDYILPIRKENGTIGGVSISPSSITFEQYQRTVGKVIQILNDGYVMVIVKTV